MKRKVLAVMMAVAMAVTVLPAEVLAQKKGGSEADDYNLQKAMEVLQKDSRDTDTALELLNKQLESTPDNVEALVLRGRINLANDNCSLALTDFNHAIRVNKPKKSGYFNSTLWWWKANVYRQSDDYELAEVNMAKSVELCRKDNPDNLINALSSYAQILYVNDKLDEADAAYREILKMDEGKVEAMVGLARNQAERGNYDDAISTLEKCRQLCPGYADVELYEALAYDGKGETDKAIDRVVELIDMDFERIDEDMMNILWKHTSYAIARMRSSVRKSENPECLKFMIAISLEHDGEYEDAIIGYMKVQEEYGGNWGERISDCMEQLGLYNEALVHIDSYLKEDPDDHSALMAKGRLLRALGMYDEALQTYGKIVDIAPDHSGGYYYKARCFEAMEEYDKALKMYDTCIDITKGDRYDFIMRGKLREKIGDSKGAEEDFRMVLKIDTTANDSSGRMYALHFLGKDDEAMEWMQKVIDGNPDDNGVWYDKACLLCLMSQPDEAMEALRKALDKGFIDFRLIRTDDDLDLIREREDFKTMVYDYRLKLEEKKVRFLRRLHEEFPEDDEAHGVTEVAFNRRGKGTFEVPCSVNGLELNMIFDTGASDVTISSVEANFMLKNGQLSREDIKGKKYYQIASGELTEGTTVTLREVKIGDAVLHNVDASVVHSQKAPLLLGQSVLERFGTITIDNINSKLLIKQ